MKPLKIIAFLGGALLLSHQADASAASTTKCTAVYSEGSSWISLTFEGKQKVTVSAPNGPRETIKQSYALKEWSCLRNGCSYVFEKLGQPQGDGLYHWIPFFPQLIVVHDYTWRGKFQRKIEFKEETLETGPFRCW